MKQINLICSAKINLTLDILGILDSGYHEIQSIMQTVSLHDDITVTLAGRYIDISTNLPYVPRDSRNIAYKAASAYFSEINATYGVKININKRIPVAAGLAGGSANGAAVIYALNTLFDFPLNDLQITELCKKIGADVPFCYFGGTALAENIGEKLTPLPNMPDCSILIAKPSRGLSTAEVYSAYDRFENVVHPNTTCAIEALQNQDIHSLSKNLGNVFEPVCETLMPAIRHLRNDIEAYNPLKAIMSGSGSSVFAIFEDKEKALYCQKQLFKKYENVFVVNPTTAGMLFK